MRISELLSEEDAVSPVIGVILMVAITVILAAVIGAFVLGLGGNQNVTPQVTFDISENDTNPGAAPGDGNVTFTHQSGDTIQSPTDKLSLAGPVNASDIDADPNDFVESSGDGFSVGDEIVAALDGGENGDEVRVVFSAEGSSDTSALVTYTLTNQEA